LTHICIISPVLQKNVCNVTNTEWIENFKRHKYGKYRVLWIMELCRSIWFCINFRRVRKIAKSDFWFLLVCVSFGRSAPNGQIFENYYLSIFQKSVQKFQF
jgi:hypothetical protein